MSFSAFEKKSLFFLSLLYILRLSGNFLILPVFAHYASTLSGEKNSILTGLALGIFGFSQALMQIPLGWLSDKVGRKQVIATCLLIFALASIGCGLSTSLLDLTVGRFIQGLCAYSSVISALLADHMAPSNRTKASALLGILIACTFVVSLSVSPVLANRWGANHLFYLMACFSLLSLIVICFFVPPSQKKPKKNTEKLVTSLSIFIKNKYLVFIMASGCLIHAVLSSFWLVLPSILSEWGYGLHQQGYVYGPVIFISFFVMGLLIRFARKKNQRSFFLPALSFVFITIGQLFLFLSEKKILFLIALTVFFSGFNTLEACLPAAVAQWAPEKIRGTAMGMYSTGQFMGIFGGGLLSGILMHYTSSKHIVFFVNFILCLIMTLLIGTKIIMNKRKDLYGINE